MNNIDVKILELIEYLKSIKEIKTAKQFCLSVGMLEQTLSKIQKGKNHFTIIQIETICQIYYVNANWVFGLEENMFLDSKPQQIQHTNGYVADNVKRQ